MPTYYLQHASSDVERMILGNKCDVNDKRQVSKDRGEQVMSGTVNNQNQEQLHFKKYSAFSPFPSGFSWHLIMESSSWRLVQRQTSMWRMWVCVMFFGLHAPRDWTTFGTLTWSIICSKFGSSSPCSSCRFRQWELSLCCTCISCFPLQAFLTLARDIKAKMDKKLVSTNLSVSV